MPATKCKPEASLCPRAVNNHKNQERSGMGRTRGAGVRDKGYLRQKPERARLKEGEWNEETIGSEQRQVGAKMKFEATLQNDLFTQVGRTYTKSAHRYLKP